MGSRPGRGGRWRRSGNSSELNTPLLDGCPSSPLTGSSSTWRRTVPAERPARHLGRSPPNRDAPWGAPENLGEPVNSAADDFCPTPIRGNGLFFVSRDAPGELRPRRHLLHPLNPRAAGASRSTSPARLRGRTARSTARPSYIRPARERRRSLYFSRSSTVVPGDIFVSRGLAGRDFGPATPVGRAERPGGERHPAERAPEDSREVVFSSNRAGTLGGQDIWVATRHEASTTVDDASVNLGGAVNTAAAETRPSLSSDALTELFGRALRGPRACRRHLRDDAEEDRPHAPLRHPGLVGRS